MLLLAVALSACSGPTMLNALAPDSGYRVASGVAYDAKHGLDLDVYVPSGAQQAPVVVFFYGGRWESGSRQEYQFVGASLARQGFVVVIPDYRLYPKVRYPAFVQDCARAVAWTHAHIGSYGGSADKLVLMGYSAGAYNAAMLALDSEFMHQVGGSRKWFKGMIGLGGPYDFMPIIDPDLRDIFGPPERFAKTQPVYYADGTNPPLLLIESRSDQVVAVKNTLALYDRVAKANGPVEKLIYPDLSHQKLIGVVSTTLSGQADILPNIVRFVRKVTGS